MQSVLIMPITQPAVLLGRVYAPRLTNVTIPDVILLGKTTYTIMAALQYFPEGHWVAHVNTSGWFRCHITALYLRLRFRGGR